MCPLVRKIDRTKWMQNDIVRGEEVSADAITNCMKTKGNALSVWKVASESSLDQAILAMSSQFEYLETIDVVVLDEPVLQDAGLQIVATPSTTTVEHLVNTHRDIVGLTYASLGTLARFIVEGFKADRVRRFTRGQLRKLLAQALKDGTLSMQDVKESVRVACTPDIST